MSAQPNLQKHQLFRVFIFLFVILTFGIACTGKEGCKKSTLPQKKTSENEAASSKLEALPALNMSGLNKAQTAALIQFTNEEICPCDCPKSFAACLQDAHTCPAGVILGQWVVERMKEGVPFDVMVEPLSKEINQGFAARPQIIDQGSYFAKGSPQ